MVEIIDERKKKIWDEIMLAERYKTNLLPQERTKKMLMEEYNLNTKQADTLIRKLRENGLITSRSAIQEGKRCKAYLIAEK